MTNVSVEDETLSLFPERGAFWLRERALLVADPHWGKAAAFRAEGIPVPSGTTAEAIERLEALVKCTGAQRVIFLGDLLHAKSGRSESMFAALGYWRQLHPDLDVLLVRGNHDRRAGDPPSGIGIECVDAPFEMRPFVFAHHPATSEHGYVIAGHIHPSIRLHGPARQSARLPCFVFGTSGAILPAFGDFTGLGDINPVAGDRIYAIADGRVVEVPSP